MPGAQPMVSKVSLEKPPQWTTEGEGSENYLKALSSPTFIAPMNFSSWEESLDNQFIDNKFAGTIDNQGVIKVRENNQVTVKGRLLPTAQCMELLRWCGNIYAGKPATYKLGTNPNQVIIRAVKGGLAGNALRFTYTQSGTAGTGTVSGNAITYNGGGSGGQTVAQIVAGINSNNTLNKVIIATLDADTDSTKPSAVSNQALEGGTRGGKDGPKESRTWVSSYFDNQDREVYRIARGCKPISVNVVFSKDDTAMLEIVMNVRDYYETRTATTGTGISGTPVYAIAEPSVEALTYEDFGDFHFDPTLKTDKSAHDTTELIFRGGNLQVAWSLRRQDSNGSLKDFYVDYGDRTTSGQFNLFKAGAELNESSRTAKQFVGWIDIQYIGGGTKGSQSDTMAENVPSGSNAVEVYSKLPGAAGNDITFEVLAASTTAEQTDIRVRGHDIQVVPKRGGDTLTNIITALTGDNLANNLATFKLKGSGGTNITSAIPLVKLSGGISKWRRIILERMKWLPSAEPMLSDLEATMENKSIRADVFTADT